MKPSLSRIAQLLPSTIPFVGPETIVRQRGRAFAARLGANESGFGPAPSVIKAMSDAAAASWAYGDPENYEVKAAIAGHLGLALENVSVGPGIDALLGLAVRLFVEAGDTVVSSLGAYPTFNYHVAGYGAVLKSVPYKDDFEDLDGLLWLAEREKPKIVYLANPDNPMGSWHPGAAVAGFAKALPSDTLLILDEAYGETAPAGTLPHLPADMPNVLRFRTFSKAYGLTGARIAYLFGAPALVSAFDKVRDHFGVSRMAQAAGIAALKDRAHLDAVLRKIAASRTQIAGIALENGFSALPSATNFVAIDCRRDAAFARRVLDGLIERDIFVRKPAAPALDRCIRVSCGPKAEMTLFAAALGEVAASLK